MSRLDDEIRSALSADDARYLEQFGADQSLHQQVLDSFRGRAGWLNIATWLMGAAFFAVFVLCAWRFAEAAELRPMLAWGGGALIAFMAMMTTKIWYWMDLHKNAVVREVKRLELQLARQSR